MKPLSQICNDDLYRFSFEPISSNMYILISGDSALVIDPCVSDEALLKLTQQGIDNVLILLTHEHYDHISGVNWFRTHFNCKLIANEPCDRNIQKPNKNLSSMFEALFMFDDKKRTIIRDMNVKPFSCSADEVFEGNINLAWKGHEIEIVSTPGHSEGSMCILIDKKHLFTGDSFITGTETITRLPGGNKKVYFEYTLPFINSLLKSVTIYPGHGC